VAAGSREEAHRNGLDSGWMRILLILDGTVCCSASNPCWLVWRLNADVIHLLNFKFQTIRKFLAVTIQGAKAGEAAFNQ